jgi:hypothetical protein
MVKKPLVGYKSINERVKWWKQESSRRPKIKERGYQAKV